MKVRLALFGLATLLAIAAIAAVRLAPTSDTAQGHVARVIPGARAPTPPALLG